MGDEFKFTRPIVIVIKHYIKDVWQVIRKDNYHVEQILEECKTFLEAKIYRDNYVKDHCNESTK